MWRRRQCFLRGVAVLAIAAMGMAPIAAGAQETGAAGSASSATSLADKRVTMDLDDIALTTAIRQLMNSVHASYTLDNALAAARVTAHLTDVRLNTALDMLMRVSSVPAEYQVEQGVYVFSRRKDAVQAVASAVAGQETTEKNSTPRFVKIQVNFVDAGMLARLLGGQAVYAGFNSFGIVDENQFRTQWGMPGMGQGSPGGGNTLLGNSGSGFGGKP